MTVQTAFLDDEIPTLVGDGEGGSDDGGTAVATSPEPPDDPRARLEAALDAWSRNWATSWREQLEVADQLASAARAYLAATE